MDLGPNASFIIAAYAMAALVVTGLIAWVLGDHEAQRRRIAELEARGTMRRADRATEAVRS